MGLILGEITFYEDFVELVYKGASPNSSSKFQTKACKWPICVFKHLQVNKATVQNLKESTARVLSSSIAQILASECSFYISCACDEKIRISKDELQKLRSKGKL